MLIGVVALKFCEWFYPPSVVLTSDMFVSKPHLCLFRLAYDVISAQYRELYQSCGINNKCTRSVVEK